MDLIVVKFVKFGWRGLVNSQLSLREINPHEVNPCKDKQYSYNMPEPDFERFYLIVKLTDSAKAECQYIC